MRKIDRYIIVFLSLLLETTLSFGQSSIQYLYDNYPCLMGEFGDDVKNCKAHYVFTIDVSGSMYQFEPTMVSCIKTFIQALPDGDKVSILPFGTKTHTTIYGYSVIISQETKATVCQEIEKLYNHPNYDSDMKNHTNIYEAVNATANAIKLDKQKYQVIVAVIGTDFQNNIPTVGGNFRTFTEDEMKTLTANWKAAIKDCYVRTVELQLEEKGGDPTQLKGFVRDVLNREVFNQSPNGIEVVPVNTNSQTLDSWFKKMNREIMVTKLKSIIDAENKAGQVNLTTSINIDGKTEAHISWNPTRLYKTMKIDSTFLKQQGFRFVNDTINYGCFKDTVRDLRLGQIKHDEWCFHKLQDSINIGVSLPTDCDNELEQLTITKPLTGAKAETDKWIFTFILPFWLTATLLGLLLLYIILTIRAAIIIGRQKLNCKINVFDIETGEQYGKTITISDLTDTSVGKGGQYKVSDADVEWTIQLKKVSPSPLCLFKTAYWEWTGSAGSVLSNNRNMGRLDYSTNTTVTLKCGVDRHTHTEKVKITMTSK